MYKIKIVSLALFFFLFQINFSLAQDNPNIYYQIANNKDISLLNETYIIEILYPFSSDSSYIKINNPNSGIAKPLSISQKYLQNYKSLTNPVNIKVSYFELKNSNSIINFLKNNHITYTLKNNRPIFLNMEISIDSSLLFKLLLLNEIKFISYLAPKVSEINFLERSNHRVTGFAANFPRKYQLTGNKISIGEWDGGDVGTHIDFQDRLTLVKNKGVSQHATHVAGTMAGAGNLDPDQMGMAPKAKIFSWDFNNDIPLEMDTNKIKYKYTLTQNSYGYWTNNCADFALYDATSTEMDFLSLKHQDLLHVFAAGNSRGMNCMSGGYKTILPGFQSAKNTISVAAVTYTDGDANFSCAGPTQDGRFKPEISAVGVNVISTIHTNTYGNNTGTSMATPGASGVLALVFERFLQKYNYTPPNFLAKNIISNTADDIANEGPDYKTGFGRINGISAVQLIDSGFWKIDSIANGSYYYDTIYLERGLHELKAMIVWNDKEVMPSVNPKLVNDLDISIIDSSNRTILPWWCNPAIPSNNAIKRRDSLNNIEQVSIKNPQSGRHIIKIYGYKVGSAYQKFSITYFKTAKAIKVVYPNGNETMLPPSSSARAQTIRWDARGISGTFNIDISKNNGNTWQSIATNIPNTQNYFVWQTLPDTVSTSKAMIKVSTSSVSDVSDTTFHITSLPNIPTTLVCDSQVFLRWKPSPNTNFYSVYMLKNGEMELQGTTSDTSFLISKLNNGIAYWFSLSKTENNGSISQRIRAISATPNNSNIPPKITLQPKDSNCCNTVNYFVKSKAIGSNPIISQWQYSIDNGLNWNFILETNDSISLKNYTNSFYIKARRIYRNTCLAPVYTRVASINIDTTLIWKFINKDSVYCKSSIVKDSIWVKNNNPVLVKWFNDSASISKLLQSSSKTTHSYNIENQRYIWAEISNYCNTYQTKNSSKPKNADGLNEQLVYSKPFFNIADSFFVCIGQAIKIEPQVFGGRNGFQKMQFIINDTLLNASSLNRKYYNSQAIQVFYFDNCYPDTFKKTIIIKTFEPLNIKLPNDTSICYLSEIQIKAMAKGGNGNYTFNWSDLGLGTNSRIYRNTISQTIYITLTDQCTEKISKDSMLIQVFSPISITQKNQNDSICQGNALQININTKGGLVNKHLINWKNSSLAGFDPVFYPNKSKWFVFEISDQCSPNIRDSFYVHVFDTLRLKINTYDTLCFNKSIILKAQISGGKANQYTLNWQPINKNGNHISYIPTTTETIYATISDACTKNNAYDTMELIVYKPLILNKLLDTQICYGNDLKIKNTYTGGKSGTIKSYFDAIQKPVLWVDSFNTKTYSYSISDACLDTIRNTFKVMVMSKLDANPKTITKCMNENKSVSFVSNNVFPLEFYWDNVLKSNQNIEIKDTSNTIHHIFLNDGCSDTSHITIQVLTNNLTNNRLIISDISSYFVKVNINKTAYTSTISWGDGLHETTQDSTLEHQYTHFKNYKICKTLEDQYQCKDSVCKDIVLLDPATFVKYKIDIFPNPAQQFLKFNINKTSRYMKIELLDINGKLLKQIEHIYSKEKHFEIDIQDLPNAVYILKVHLNNEVLKQKWIKTE